MKYLRDELKEKYSGLHRATFEKGHRSAAIRLFCLGCMGGVAAEVKACTEKECPLYAFRLSKKVEKGMLEESVGDLETTIDAESHRRTFEKRSLILEPLRGP